MKVIKPDNLSLLFSSVMLQKELLLSVAAMGFFSLDSPDAPAEARLMDEGAMWRTVAASLDREEPLDLCQPKVEGEFLVYGSCFAKQGARAALARVEVGGIVKELLVSGNQHWGALGIPSKPELFTEMKICHGNAFGGPGYKTNPVGKGFAPDETGKRPLPNIQDPEKPMGLAGELPAPVGFTAYPPAWPQRAKYFGKFDGQWLKNRWPHYPLDTDLRHFNTAPVDQRLDGFFTGDERVLIVNMHPDKTEIVSSLPAVRARIFANRATGGGPEFAELSAKLDTVWLFPDKESGIVLFRGVMRVEDEELDDVLHLMAEWEPLQEPPKPLEHYHRLFLEALEPPPVEAAPPPEPAPAPVSPPSPEPPPIPQAEAKPEEQPPELASIEKELAEMEAQTDAKLRKLGLTREELMEKYLPKPPPTNPLSLEQIRARIGEIEAQNAERLEKLGMTPDGIMGKYLLRPEANAPAGLRDIAKHIGEMEAGSEAKLRELGMTREELVKKSLPGFEVGRPMPAEELEKVIAELETQAAPEAPAVPLPEMLAVPAPKPLTAAPLVVEEVMERYGRGETLSGLDLTGLDFTGRDLTGADLSRSILDKAVFRDAKLASANLTGAVLGEADCAGADLSGADLSKSMLDKTAFAKAKLSGADLSEAVMTEADFTGANLTGAKLTGANGTAGRFCEAGLAKADLTRGDFAGADFSGSDLTEAVLAGASFEKASMRKIKAVKAAAPKADFSFADLSGADFSDAELTEADLSYANLSGARFIEAEADKIRLDGATGAGPDFSRAKMRESRGDRETSFTDACLKGAWLPYSCWGGANLAGAQLEEANLDYCDFSGVRFSGCTFLNAVAREANFMKALIEASDMRGVNLFKCSLRKARISESDLRDSHLFGADLYGAKLVNCDMRGADLQRTLLTLDL